MRTGLQQRAEAVFLRLIEVPGPEREGAIASACAGDVELEREVRSLLACHDEAGTFLDAAELRRSFPGLDLPSPEDEFLPEGTRLGGFVVRRLIGSGGMGNVYVAEQDRPRRTVALKVIRRGMGTRGLVRRFEHEAEILGRLHHPGIAQVYEAGAAEAGDAGTLAFIAMELIHGPTLTAFATDKALSTHERLELVARVCDAVHHAHQRGVIHRDLKPANILVDEHAQPKVLDFGVARAADADLRVTTMRTSVGQLIGTLPYMSPEQVLGDPGEVDTRSDVYALGVVLYQLLTGKLPLEVSSRSIAEAARIVRDESPTRIGRLDRSFRGDIETVVERALEKDKARRYQSAADLGADLRRIVAGEPIHARQDSAFYALRAQIRRNKAAVLVTLAAFIGVTAFAIYASINADEQRRLAKAAQRALALAKAAGDRANAANADLGAELSRSNIERGRLLGRSGSLAAAEDLLWPEHLRRLHSRQTFFALWELYARNRCAGALPANSPRTNAIALSPDGLRLACVGLDPPVAVWSTETFDRAAVFGREGVEHLDAAWSPDGTLACSDAAGAITRWNPETGNELTPLREASAGAPAALAPATDLAFDRTGRYLGAVLSDGSALLIDARASPPATIVHRTGIRARSLAFDPARDEVAIGCVDERVEVCSLPDLAEIASFENPNDAFPSVAYSRDGRRLAAAGNARLVRIWDRATGTLEATLASSNGGLRGACFSPDGERLVAAGWWQVEQWDIASGRVVEAFSGYRASATNPTLSPDGAIAWINMSGSIRAWEVDPDAGRVRIPAESTRSLLVFAPEGELLAGEPDGSIQILDDRRGLPVATLGSTSRRVRSIAISPSGGVAASANVAGILSVWDLRGRRLLGQWPGYRTTTYDSVRFDSTGSRLLVPTEDNAIAVVEVPSGRRVLTIPPAGPEALGVAFSADDRMIAASYRNSSVRVYDAGTGALLRVCDPTPSSPWSVVFSPDGTKVLSGLWDGTIGVWNVATGRIERRLQGHRGLVTDLHFRPREPSILASSGAEGGVMLWDLSLPIDVPVLSLSAFEATEAWSLDFDQAGRRLVATGGTGLSYVWDLRYFNRHIGANMEAWVARQGPPEGYDEAAAHEQRALLLTRGRPEPLR